MKKGTTYALKVAILLAVAWGSLAIALSRMPRRHG